MAVTRRACALALVAACLVAGCATRPPPAGDGTGPWSGRLVLRLDSHPPQSFTAGFELKGRATSGELSLFTPLGSTAARLAWGEGKATLQTGTQVQEFDSLDALATQATGTALPVAALFDWLRGVPTQVAGWHTDLSGLDAGRLNARRIAPLPAAEMRLVLDR